MKICLCSASISQLRAGLCSKAGAGGRTNRLQHCRKDRHGAADPGGHAGAGGGRRDGAAAVPAARRNRGRLQRDSGRGAAGEGIINGLAIEVSPVVFYVNDALCTFACFCSLWRLLRVEKPRTFHIEKPPKTSCFRWFLVEISGIEPLTS